MLPLGFFAKVVLVTSSGALSPGPLTASTVAAGTQKGWKAGFWVSVGHTIVEFPLVFLIAVGVALIFANPLVRWSVGTIGGIILILLGLFMVRDTWKNLKKPDSRNDIDDYTKNSGNHNETDKSLFKSPLMIGILLSGLNPYFIVWWIFIGGALVIEAFEIFGFTGVFLMYFAHVWMDYAFLILLSSLAYKGKSILTTRGYAAFLVTISLIIIIFGVDLLMRVNFGLSILP